MYHFSESEKDRIINLCQKHKVKEFFVFGSALRDDFDRELSDMDFIVQFSDQVDLLTYSKNYFSFQFALEDLFQKPIDLMTFQELKNPVLKEEIERSKLLLYAA